MLELHQYPRAFGIPNLSPFCLKVETWLRMTGIEHRVVEERDPRRGPLGKMPWVVDGGEAIPDSSLIVEHLKSSRGLDPDGGLSARERAVSLAAQRLMEDHLYHAMVLFRWVTDEGFAHLRPMFRGIPRPVRDLVMLSIRRRIARDLRGHGIGRQPLPTVWEMARSDISALSELLGERVHFFGDEPVTLDAIAYAFLANVLFAPIERSLADHARSLGNLEPFCERMHARFFPDLERPGRDRRRGPAGG